jgi:hypothetical protein
VWATTSNTSAPLVRAFLASVSLFLPCVSGASTSAEICHDPGPESHLSIAYYGHDKSPLGTSGGTSDLENFSTDLLYNTTNKWAYGFGHRTTILNVDGLDLQTNGYLHTFFFPVHRHSNSDNGSFRFSIAPALSGSSNVVKDPGEYSADALQLLAALVWERPLNERWAFSYGICGDHRFGNYRVYPTVGATWQPHPSWSVEFGFPRSRLSFQVSRSLALVLRIEPNGNEWYVKDKSLQTYSQLLYEANLLEWALNWRAHEHFMVSASIGREFDRHYELALLDEGVVRLPGDDTTRIGVALAWVF